MSPVTPTKYGEALHGGVNLFGHIFWGDILHGDYDQIMQGRKLMVKSLKRSTQVSISSHWSCTGLSTYYLKSYQHKWGTEFEKHCLHTLPLGFRISCKVCLLFKKNCSGDLFFDVLIIGFFRFMYLRARLMEKWVKVLHSESEGSWVKPRPLVTLG